MTILECGDATDVESILDVAEKVHGPVYIRMLRGKYLGSSVKMNLWCLEKRGQ